MGCRAGRPGHIAPGRARTTAMLLLAAALGGACGTDDTTSTSGTGGTAAASRETAIVVSVTRGTVSPPAHRIKVAQDAALRITVTSDTSAEFHLHGYDRTLRLATGTPGTLRLTADRPGVFEAELHQPHGPGTRLFELQVG